MACDVSERAISEDARGVELLALEGTTASTVLEATDGRSTAAIIHLFQVGEKIFIGHGKAFD